MDYFKLQRKLKRRPLDYFRGFYADTALFGALEVTKCGLKFFGAERVLFSSMIVPINSMTAFLVAAGPSQPAAEDMVWQNPLTLCVSHPSEQIEQRRAVRGG